MTAQAQGTNGGSRDALARLLIEQAAAFRFGLQLGRMDAHVNELRRAMANRPRPKR